MYIQDKTLNLNTIAAFIAKLNNKKQYHVGYIGDYEEEIRDSIQNEFSDQENLDRLFTLAYDNNHNLIGLLGFNEDFNKKTAEIWGPYIIAETEEDYLRIATQLWHTGIQKLGAEISVFHGFYNRENLNANQFMKLLGAKQINEHIIMKKYKPTSQIHQNDAIQEITPEYYSSFTELHDQTFPSTYYTGQDIIQMLNEDCKLFIYPSGDTVAGYCFIEGNPMFQEGSIEYISVASSSRNQGIGSALLHRGLDYLFAELLLKDISICVDASNQGAVRLYESVGFDKENRLDFYKIRLVD